MFLGVAVSGGSGLNFRPIRLTVRIGLKMAMRDNRLKKKAKQSFIKLNTFY